MHVGKCEGAKSDLRCLKQKKNIFLHNSYTHTRWVSFRKGLSSLKGIHSSVSRVCVWHRVLISSEQMADVLISTPSLWDRWFMGELVMRLDAKWPYSLCECLRCTEDNTSGLVYCVHLCDRCGGFFPFMGPRNISKTSSTRSTSHEYYCRDSKYIEKRRECINMKMTHS